MGQPSSFPGSCPLSWDPWNPSFCHGIFATTQSHRCHTHLKPFRRCCIWRIQPKTCVRKQCWKLHEVVKMSLISSSSPFSVASTVSFGEACLCYGWYWWCCRSALCSSLHLLVIRQSRGNRKTELKPLVHIRYRKHNDENYCVRKDENLSRVELKSLFSH